MRRVLVAHMDSGVGRRLVKALYHDPDVSLVFGVGTGPTPSFLDPYREKVFYQRIDLARARHLMSFFNSERLDRARLDSVIFLPFGGEPRHGQRERIPGNVPQLVSETRRLLEACRRDERIGRFVFLSSAFVYSPEPGSACVMNEEQDLSFDADGNARVRAWIDADLLCQNQLKEPGLKVTILRSAAIVTEAGEFLHCPPLEAGPLPIGYDPMVSVVSDRDVARALVLALHADLPGIYNVASRQVFPCSELRSETAHLGPLPVPDLLSGSYTLLSQALRRSRPQTYQRYGVVLDTSRAHEPQYRLELRGRGAERRLDSVRCR
jgi:nucleoside-diphosphate-sugar epimerase